MGELVKFPVDEIEMDFAMTIVDLAKSAPTARQMAVLKGMEVFNKMMHHALENKDQKLMDWLLSVSIVDCMSRAETKRALISKNVKRMCAALDRIIRASDDAGYKVGELTRLPGRGNNTPSPAV